MLRLIVLAVCLAAVVFLLLTCGGGSSGPAVGPTQTALPTPTDIPSGTRTGIPEIDTVLDTVFAGDEEAVRALMQYTSVPCTTEVSIDPGKPAFCQVDEPEGTLVEAFREANCHGNLLRPEETGEIVATLSQLGGNLRAVVRGRALGISAGDYVAVYDDVSIVRKDAAFAVMIADGKIVGAHATCGMTTDGFLEFNNLDEFLLYNPEEPRTGIPEIDTVLDTVFAGDEEAVRALIGYTPTVCTTDPEGIGSPPQCLGEETEGSFADVFAVGYCHGVYVRPEDMGGVIATLSRPGARLRAVSPVIDLWPSGDYVVIYDHVRGPEEPFDPDVILGGTDRPPDIALTLVLRDGAIVGILDACQGTPEEFLQDRTLDPILFNPPDG